MAVKMAEKTPNRPVSGYTAAFMPDRAEKERKMGEKECVRKQ
jgi:hypothetical protein